MPPINPLRSLDLGHVIEGVVEVDPMTDHLVIREEGYDGVECFDVQTAMEAYVGQNVRFVVVPFSTINVVAEMVEKGDVSLEDANRR